jgi:PAS domain S-box-containing protein
VIAVVAADGTILYHAGPAAGLLGCDRDEITGANLTDWVDPDHAPRLIGICRTGESAGAEFELRRGDGSSRVCELRASSVLEHPAWNGVVVNIRDVSERKRLEVELHLAHKLEAVGQLAAGIAHEINTPVQYVTSSLHFLDGAFADLVGLQRSFERLERAAADAGVELVVLAEVAEAKEAADLEYLQERVPKAFARSLDGLRRVAEIVAAMRVFGGRSTEGTEPVDINPAIENTLVVAANEYKYVADIVTDLDEIPAVLANHGDINQVLINLIVNASHAIAEVVGGSAQRGTIKLTTRANNADAILTITDTGCGIPPDIADRIFDHFFTTKEIGEGTGQGLAITRAIIDRHHGRISFDSTPGKGTTFTIHLPLAAANVPSAAKAA